MATRAELLQRYYILDQRITDLQRAASRAWGGQRSQMERKLAALDEQQTAMHQELFPVCINGQAQVTGPPACRVDGCESEGKEYEQNGLCDPHFALATGTITDQDRATLTLTMNGGRQQ
jgi:hypothetical protein